jgi:hypothetical protein
VIPARKDEVTDETLVSIDDEVAPEFFWLFVLVYQLGGG